MTSLKIHLNYEIWQVCVFYFYVCLLLSINRHSNCFKQLWYMLHFYLVKEIRISGVRPLLSNLIPLSHVIGWALNLASQATGSQQMLDIQTFNLLFINNNCAVYKQHNFLVTYSVHILCMFDVSKDSPYRQQIILYSLHVHSCLPMKSE